MKTEIPFADLLRICESLVESSYETVGIKYGRYIKGCKYCFSKEKMEIESRDIKLKHEINCPVPIAEFYIARCKSGPTK